MQTIAIPLACLVAFLPPEKEPAFKSLDFDAACKAAAKEKKVVLIDFYTTWCGPCKVLDKTTWKDKQVRDWLIEKTIALKLDAEKEKALAKKYDVTSYPTLLFLKPDGTEIDRLIGYKDAEGFLEEAKAALSGKDSIARAKEKLKGNENNPMERMNVARALAQKRKNAEALEEYLWCFDHGLEHEASFTGVRLSFLLRDIAQLGQSYPPALKAMEERRDKAEAAVRKAVAKKEPSLMPGGPAFNAAMEFSALNRTLDDDERTLKFFDELAKKGDSAAQLRQLMLRDVMDRLLEARRYEDILAAVEDPIASVEQNLGTYEMTKRIRGSKMDKALLKQADESYKKHVAQEATKYYEALIGAGKTRKAEKLARRLIQFDKSDQTFAALINRAVHAERYDAARGLVERAEKDLDEEDLTLVRKAARAIPEN